MTRRPPLVRVLSLNIVLSILMWVLSDGNFFDRGRKPPSWNAGNRLVVIIIGLANIRPLNVIVILISVLKVDFTIWWISTAVKNHVTGKTMCGLVVNHIGFANIRLLKIF